MAQPEILPFTDFSAGLAESKFRGVEGSFAKAVGIDIHSEPGVLKAQFALKKDSGSTVVDKILAIVFTSLGHSYWFGDAGTIYKRTSGGTWSLETTVSGTPKILGAAEHSDGYVYFTYSNKVGRILVSDDTVTASWNTLDNTNTNFGPVIYHEKLDKIFIGNKNQVAQVDESSAFTSNKLDLLDVGYEIRDISWLDINVLIGATDSINTNRSRIFDWDGFSASWQFSWFFSEEIKWMQNQQDVITMLAGNEGNLYQFTGNSVELVSPRAHIPGAYSSTSTFESTPNSKVVHNGLIHFGVYDGAAGNPYPNGIYTYGTKDLRRLPPALNCEYVISPDKTTGIEIGAISTDGTKIYVAWKDSSTYGVDIIDTANRYSGAYIEFLTVTLDMYQTKNFVRFPTNLKPLPASCSVEMQQKLDEASSFTSVATVSTTNAIDDEKRFDGASVADGKIIQTKLILTPSGTATPEIFQHAIVFMLLDFEQ